jgi:hypothetical protein
MSEEWPPEWEDPEEEFPGEADQLDATGPTSGGEARLSEVAAFLASVPAPAMPDAVEARISAALAAQAALGGTAPPALDPAAADRPAPAGRAMPAGAGPTRTPPRVRRRRGGGGPRRESRFRPALAAGTLATCLVLAGLGYAVSLGGSSTSSSFASSANAPAAGSAAAGSSAGGAVPPRAAAPEPEYASGSGSSFSVTVSGTKYQLATLADQVRVELAAIGRLPSPGSTVPAASASSSSPGAGPSAELRGCVLAVTDGAAPRLVDQATYQGDPAYIIASSSQVWVVGLGCTAANTDLVQSVPLAGLPGNLRALISVEQQAFTGRRVQ